MITLSSPVTYTSTISPVCLPNSNDQFADQEAAIVGWGTTSEGDKTKSRLTQKKTKKYFRLIAGGSVASVLQQATVKVTTNAQCKASYMNLGAGMLCAAAPGKDTCQVTAT